MEMDCYPPEYKHHIHPNHQHYGGGNNAAANHPYYPGNYSPASMRYAHAHAPFENGIGQQPAWTDNYTRYNQAPHHHLNHLGNYSNNSFNGHYGAAAARESYHANGEGSGQFYYQNAAHQASPGYYGNHSYDSYRNASPSAYHYHYGAGGGNTNFHQTASAPTSQYYPPSYNAAAAEQQFNNRYYPTPPPSTPPTSSQRDPYSLAAHQQQQQHPNETASAASPYSLESSDLNDKQINERLSRNDTKSTLSDPVASADSSPHHHSPLVKLQSTTESGCCDEKDEKEETKADESLHEASASNSDEVKAENTNESVKAEDKKSNDDESDARADDQSTSLINETTDHKPLQISCNESAAPKADSLKSQDTATDVENSAATDYLFQQTARDRHRRSPREKEKCLKSPNLARKSLEMNSNANDPFNRCSTPFVSMPSTPFNHNHVPPHSYPPHQRLPPNFPHAAAQNYWYSQQHPPSHPHHHNWMMNPYMRNRRGSYTDAQMLPSSIQYNRNVHSEKQKMYEESSPPPKRTKRKPKPDPPSRLVPKDDIMKNVTPLPGFLQTFGGTEIGRFSEAFFTSSESPNPYYNNSIESDVESPQPWDFDSLDGPVNMQVGAAFQVYGSETEYDSPVNNFSELICNEY